MFPLFYTGLQSTKLSDLIETRVNTFLKREGAAPNVTIKVVSVCDKQVEVKPGMRMRWISSLYCLPSLQYNERFFWCDLWIFHFLLKFVVVTYSLLLFSNIPFSPGLLLLPMPCCWKNVSKLYSNYIFFSVMYRFGGTGHFPDSFPYRAKAMFAFEEIDGVDVCFFGMHVQEYSSDSVQPNTRRVYVSYLDSVHFFQPRHLRTAVYHEILIGYLEHVGQVGYVDSWLP